MNSLICALIIAGPLGQSGGLDADFETALGTAGLTTRSARFDATMLRFFRSGEFATPLYQSCIENPWRIPFISENLRAEASTLAGVPSGLVMTGGRLLGAGTRRTLLGNPNQAEEEAAKKNGALGAILDTLKKDGVVKGNLPSLKNVPKETQQAAALVLGVVRRVVEMRRLAFSRAGSLTDHYDQLATLDEEPEGSKFDILLTLYRSVDLSYLFAGGHDVVRAAETAQTLLGTISADTAYRVEIDTSWGQIVLTGGADDKHLGKPTLLLIDTGGNDIYINPARNANAGNWASVLIDTNGSDKYLGEGVTADTPISRTADRKNKTAPGPASALFGYSVLIDRAGNDLYRTIGPGLGSATFGVSVLLDKAGDDTYDGYRNSQGYGSFGIGILEDQAGKDSYAAFTQSQGCGLTMGYGMLRDGAGDDKYVANDEQIDFPSAQSAQHNNSMSQGAGYGRRADYSDGHSLAGGVGILFDEKGNDEYSCGVFGQGVGYWEGVGMLWDSDGFDTYSGQWYVQGAAAHFAVGYLEDVAGNDRYTATMNMAQGAGHDFSVGCLIDGGGVDSYKAPNLSLGAGNANGIGILVEMGGNDTYESTGISLGRSAEAAKGSLRTRTLSLGLFMDLGGTDTYPAFAIWAKPSTKVANWMDKGYYPEEGQLGIFWDR